MAKHHLFRDIALVTIVKVMVIVAAGWIVFGRPPKVDAGSTAARLIGMQAVSPLSREIAP
jgi:hypothetical protein